MAGPEVVGIDLGTTRSVVVSSARVPRCPRVFRVQQLVNAREVAELETLPSALYAPLEGEVAGEALSEAHWVAGEFALRRASETTGRAIVSAKSWLSHHGVDRTEPILPWPASDDLPGKLSPVDATRRLLEHLRRCWNVRHPDSPLERQLVILTVPASFDQVARQLTLRAAAQAELSVRLLEEPIAAFYAFLEATSEEHLAQLLGGREKASVLVCDVGGGTTDFSLIRLEQRGARVTAHRVAVGRHLLLGGDNIDLALAHTCEPRLLEHDEDRLPRDLFAQLVYRCRTAKERLLGNDPPPSVAIVLTERGSRLVGSVRRTELGQDEASTILESFMPRVPLTAPLRPRSGLVGFGLPYEAESGITRHLAQFLRTNLPNEAPLGVLLNGGLFKSAAARRHLACCLADWYGAEPLVFDSGNVETAVAHGAVDYGFAILGQGRRIHSGTSEAYFIGLGSESGRRMAVCIIPRGSQEGDQHLLQDTAYGLKLGQAIRFDLYTGTKDAYQAGQIVDLETERLEPLGPLVTEFTSDTGQREVRVHLEGELSATGCVDLACVPTDVASGGKLQLAFDLTSRGGASEVVAAPQPSSSRWLNALECLDRVYGKGKKEVKARESRDLVRNLERALGPRKDWSVEVNRRIVDSVLERNKARTRSADHERMFWLLTGYCLRPGTGAPGDERRAAACGELFHVPLRFPQESRSWQQLWIAVRRTAAGLSEALQASLRDMMDPQLGILHTSKSKKGPKALGLGELVEAASYLERVDPRRKLAMGDWLLERTWTDKSPKLWEAIARLGSRVPIYSSLHYVVPPNRVESWLDLLMREKWRELPVAVGCAVSMARYTGDRNRDIGDAKRAQLIAAMQRAAANPEDIRKVAELVPIELRERTLWLGDDLPQGLSLL